MSFGNFGGSYWDRGNSSLASPDAAINAAVQAAIADASTNFAPLQFEGEYPKSGFGIATLRAKDLAVTNQATAALQSIARSSIVWGPQSVAAASVWQDWLNINVDSRIYTIVTGIFNTDPTPNITNVRFKANGEDQPVLSIEELASYDVSYMFLEKPIGVKPGNNLTARIVAPAARAGVENLGLLGYTLAKRAYLITE